MIHHDVVDEVEGDYYDEDDINNDNDERQALPETEMIERRRPQRRQEQQDITTCYSSNNLKLLRKSLRRTRRSNSVVYSTQLRRQQVDIQDAYRNANVPLPLLPQQQRWQRRVATTSKSTKARCRSPGSTTVAGVLWYCYLFVFYFFHNSKNNNNSNNLLNNLFLPFLPTYFYCCSSILSVLLNNHGFFVYGFPIRNLDRTTSMIQTNHRQRIEAVFTQLQTKSEANQRHTSSQLVSKSLFQIFYRCSNHDFDSPSNEQHLWLQQQRRNECACDSAVTIFRTRIIATRFHYNYRRNGPMGFHSTRCSSLFLTTRSNDNNNDEQSQPQPQPNKHKKRRRLERYSKSHHEQELSSSSQHISNNASELDAKLIWNHNNNHINKNDSTNNNSSNNESASCNNDNEYENDNHNNTDTLMMIMMMKMQIDTMNHKYDQIVVRTSQLENIVSSQQVIIRKLTEQYKELSETTEAFAELIYFLKNSPSSSTNPSSTTTGSTTSQTQQKQQQNKQQQQPASFSASSADDSENNFYDDDDDADDEEEDDEDDEEEEEDDVLSNRRGGITTAKKSSKTKSTATATKKNQDGSSNGKTNGRDGSGVGNTIAPTKVRRGDAKYIEAYEDTNIFGTAPETVLEAADVAGASILSGVLAGQQRMLVDVRDAELNSSVETFVQFLELAVLPVAAGLEGLRGPRNRLKLVFPTVSELLQYRKTMCLSAPEVVALSTLGFDPIEAHDNIVVIIAPSPDDIEGMAKMNELLAVPTTNTNVNVNSTSTTASTTRTAGGIAKPVVVLNRHMIPITGPAAKFEVAYHLRLLSVQYMSASGLVQQQEQQQQQKVEEQLRAQQEEAEQRQLLLPISAVPELETYEITTPPTTAMTIISGSSTRDTGNRSSFSNVSSSETTCIDQTDSEISENLTLQRPPQQQNPNEDDETSVALVEEETLLQEDVIPSEVVAAMTGQAPFAHEEDARTIQGPSNDAPVDGNAFSLSSAQEQQAREIALEAVLKKTHAAVPHPLENDNDRSSSDTTNGSSTNSSSGNAHDQYIQPTFYGTTRAMVIRAYPHSWNVFVDTSPDDTTADFEVAAVFDNEPSSDEIHAAIVSCLEGSEQEDEVVAHQMQQAYEAGQLDRISEFLASIMKEEGEHSVDEVDTKSLNDDEDDEEDEDDDDDDIDEDDPYTALFGIDDVG